ncbi:MAG: hypothetical protein MUC50_20170 [Myxococcota bacterium]|jgi:hypothetical protein|nr:hypothetical protein [Myxococcota bacterium]
MFISRFWTLLLALATGAMLTVILLAKDVVNRERTVSATMVLYKEMSKTELALKLHARKRLDVLLNVASDPDVRKALSQVSNAPDKADSVRDDLLASLRKRNTELDKYAADWLMAVDARGIVIAQAGVDERRSGADVSGKPAVAAAMRGYLRDDTWKIEKDVFLVAARPVIDGERYVGAVVHLTKLSDKLAQDISPNTQLAFYSGDMILALGAGVPDTLKAQGAHVAKVLDQVAKNESYLKNGYTDVLPIETQEGRFMGVYSRVRGEAGLSNVGFALVLPVEQLTNATEFYEKSSEQDIRALPWVVIILLVLMAMALGWVWNYLEGERPVSRLLAHVRALKEADPKDQLNVYKFRRRIRKVAMAINEVMDFKIQAMLESPDRKSQSIDAILGTRGSDSRLSVASFKLPEPGEAPPPPGLAMSKPGPGFGAMPPAPPPAAVAAPPSPPPQAATAGTGPMMKLGATGPVKPMGRPSPSAEPTDDVPEVGSVGEQAYFQKIYDEFFALKKQLGESVDQLTFDRFAVTLRKNRDALIARYACKAVKFQVYEKDGKASLKATPVKA